MPARALEHFNEDLARARAILAQAASMPSGTDAERLLRDDFLRCAYMFAVGAFDAYSCDAVADMYAAVLIASSRDKGFARIPIAVIVDMELPAGAIAKPYRRENWHWRMLARSKMESQNILHFKKLKKHMNLFFRPSHKLFHGVLEDWMQRPGARTRVFRYSYRQYTDAIAGKTDAQIENIQNEVVTHMNKRYSKHFERRHRCIHQCDRRQYSLSPLSSADTVRKAVEDIIFLVENLDRHVQNEIYQLLNISGFRTATMHSVGYANAP